MKNTELKYEKKTQQGNLKNTEWKYEKHRMKI